MRCFIASCLADVNKPSEEEPTGDRKLNGGLLMKSGRGADSGELRDWLVVDDSSQPMFCSQGRQRARAKSRDNGFIVSTLKSKLEATEDHEASACHKEKSALERTAVQPENSTAREDEHFSELLIVRTTH